MGKGDSFTFHLWLRTPSNYFMWWFSQIPLPTILHVSTGAPHPLSKMHIPQHTFLPGYSLPFLTYWLQNRKSRTERAYKGWISLPSPTNCPCILDKRKAWGSEMLILGGINAFPKCFSEKEGVEDTGSVDRNTTPLGKRAVGPKEMLVFFSWLSFIKKIKSHRVTGLARCQNLCFYAYSHSSKSWWCWAG